MVERLINNSLNNLGRATDMLWIAIGNPRIIEILFANGEVKKKEVTDFAIHFQCQWRFVTEGRILLASHDIYNPYDSNLKYDDDWNWDTFDLHIDFDKGIYFDTFITCSTKREYYRFIDFDKNEHTVIFDELNE